LVGGDVITSFDGKAIRNEDDLQKAIRTTTVGKTLEVIYKRDGEIKKTNLTTVNEDEIDRLRDIFDDTQKGFLGVDDLERVPVPNSNIYGIRVGRVLDNRAAFFGDMKEGDIVIEFNGTPIRTPEEFESRIRRTKPLNVAKTIIMRDGQKMELNIKVGKN
jgi:S1-C subfamily serine protease